MLRRGVALLALGVAILGLGRGDAWAHAGVRLSDPVAGATLGDTPTKVLLSFSEALEPKLSSIRVLDIRGAAYQVGRAQAVAGDPRALSVRVRPLPRGVYTVSWRVFSSVDGHTTAGSYAFGVLVAPTGSAAAETTANPSYSRFEMLARWILLTGLVALLGAAAAAVARFGRRSAPPLGAGGWLLATLGLALLAEAQRRNASSSYAELLGSSIGRALIGRALALGAAGGALVVSRVARRARPAIRRAAMICAALAAMAAMAEHVSAGHAAAGSRWLPAAASVGLQWAHLAAAGIWLGGLAALLLDLRGAEPAAKASSVRRFSNIAAAGLIIVAVTGAVRSLEELSARGELIATGYGRAVLAKIGLIAAIAALGAVNRWRSVPAATTSLRLLRRAGSGELVLAAGALAAAAMMGSLAPPAGLASPPGLSVSGADFGTTVRVRLTAPSDQPGPNRFVVHAVDYDSKRPLRAARVSLRFSPIDDPGEDSTTLPLEPGPGGSFAGSGANLAFEGRWRVNVLIERAGDSVEVPLEVETSSRPQPVFIERKPGRAPTYRVEVARGDMVRFSPDPERPGRSKVDVTCFDRFGEDQLIEGIVVTAAAGLGPTRQAPVRRLEINRFVADVKLRPGRNRITAIARTDDGTRLRAAVDLDVPNR